MTKDEKAKRNIGLAFDLFREIIKNPALGDKIPNGSTVVFLDKDQSISQKAFSGKTNKYVKIKRQFEVVEEV